jgi:hypothetical protein
VKRLSAALALTALAAAAAALAQQQTPTQPPASSSAQEQSQTTPPPGDRGPNSKADEQTLMRNCLKKMQATNAPAQDVKDYCEKKVKSDEGG